MLANKSLKKKRPYRRKTFVATLAVVFITVAVFWFSSSPKTEVFKLQLAFVLFLIFILHRFIRRHTFSPSFSFLLFFAFMLALVTATGGFVSPFFFSLYLLAIALALIFNLTISFSFLATLIIFFLFELKEMNIYEFLTLVSLFSVVPVVLYVRKQYFRLKTENRGGKKEDTQKKSLAHKQRLKRRS